jgi:signal transduction histidine kinase
VSAGVDAPAELAALLEAAERLFRRGRGPDRELEALLPPARERAAGLAVAAGGTQEAVAAAILTFCGELVSGMWLERSWTRPEAEELVEQIAGLVGYPPPLVTSVLYLRAAREQRALELPPRLAIETQLRMLQAFAPVEEASVWTRGPDGSLAATVGVGASAESRRARELAREILAGNAPEDAERARLHGVPVLRWQQPVAALVVRAAPDDRAQALALAHEAAATVSPLLHLDGLLARSAARERALVETTERHLVRLGFDIHDGALQELAALASDIRLFQAQLAEVVEGDEREEVVLGRVADLEGRVVAIDQELRELTQSLESPAAVTGSLPDAIAATLRRFGEETGLPHELDLQGDLEDLTSSQTIALTRIVQEALSNVRDHSGASSVRVAARGTKALLEVEINDDGRGFDVEERLVEAARGGRLGLIGMAERVRLLGGRLDVSSTPGGPTTVTARIPRWRPPAQGGEGAGSS